MNMLKRGLPYILSAAFAVGALGCEPIDDPDLTSPEIKVEINQDKNIRLKNRTIIPDNLEKISLDLMDKINNADKSIHVILQYGHNLTNEEIKELASRRVIILDPIASKTYFAAIPATTEGLEERLNPYSNEIRFVGDILPQDKISPHLSQGRVAPWAEADDIVGLNILFHNDVNPKEMREKLEDLGAVVNSTLDAASLAGTYGLPDEAKDAISLANVTLNKNKLESFIEDVSACDEVKYVTNPTIPLSNLNFNGRRTTKVDFLQQAYPALDGTDTRLVVYDGGLVNDDHPDFEGRVEFYELEEDRSQGATHPTHVAGTAAGDGKASIQGFEQFCSDDGYTHTDALRELCALFAISEDTSEFETLFRGVAPKAHILSMDHGDCNPYCYHNTPNNLLVKFIYANIWDAHLLTSSTGSNVSRNGYPCEFNGDYEISSLLIDFLIHGVFGLDPLSVFYAAGNERGSSRCFMEGDDIGYRTIGIPATCKNAIKVGATTFDDIGNIVLSNFSGFGPTDDGRLGVTVVVHGGGGDICVVSAAGSYNPYGCMSGTSMATPLAAGISLLLNQSDNMHNHGNKLSPHLLKALLAGTAWDIGPYGVDYMSGFGYVDAFKAEEIIRSNKFKESHIGETGGYVSYLIRITNDLEPIKITMAYTDVKGALASQKALVNDLDMVLISPDGRVIKPLVLNPEYPQAIAHEGEDHLNNIEQIVYHLSADDIRNRGLWKVVVKGYDVVSGPVDFAIVSNQGLYDFPDFRKHVIDKEKFMKPVNFPFK